MVGFDVEPGDALLFDYRILHRSRGNASPRRRVAVSWRWLGDDATWAPEVGTDPQPERVASDDGRQRGMEQLLSTTAKFGADLSIAAGPIGGGAKAQTTDILAFARSRGLYGGVSLEGAVMKARHSWNQAYYGAAQHMREDGERRTAIAEAQIAREIMKFAENGLLYRGSKPVMWSVVEKTALAEAEVEYEDRKDPAIDVGFPFAEPGAVAKAFGLAGLRVGYALASDAIINTLAATASTFPVSSLSAAVASAALATAPNWMPPVIDRIRLEREQLASALRATGARAPPGSRAQPAPSPARAPRP